MPATIAVLADDYIEYQKILIDSIAAELDRRGYGVVCITGSEIDQRVASVQPGVLGGRVYAIHQADVFAGLISLSGTIGNSVSIEELSAFVGQYDVPSVSVGIELPDMPNVMVDDRAGMFDLMRHLITETDAQRFAFVQGLSRDPYSERREQIFRSLLIHEGYEVNESLIVRGNYDPLQAFQVVGDLLENHPDIDAIVSANDAMALSAARAATTLGYTIPDDILITGFDDTGEASRHSPALTTVRQPLVEMAKQSVELLIAKIDPGSRQNQSDSIVTVASELVVRGSTRSATLSQSGVELSPEALYQHIKSALSGLSPPAEVDLRSLTDSLTKTLVENRDFVSASLEEVSLENIALEQQHWWSNLCYQLEVYSARVAADSTDGAFHSYVVAALSGIKERLWALSMQREFGIRTYHDWNALMHLQMSSCIQHDEILSTTATWLGNIKPKRWYLVWNASPGTAPDSKSKLVQHVDNKDIRKEVQSFDTADLLPASLVGQLHQGLMIMNPVFVQGYHYGYVLFDPEGMSTVDVASVSRSIGNAMRSRHLMQQLESQAKDLERVNDELEQLANRDALTGLPNRFNFQHRLQAAVDDITDSQKVAVIFIDLDGFKAINDTMGHDCGDALLKIIANRLKHVVSAFGANGFVARLGGDEFTVVVKDSCRLSDENIARLSKELLHQACQPCDIDGRSVLVSASIGYAIGYGEVPDAETLLSRADSAMYVAKESGKNTVAAFSSAVAAADQRRRHLEENLRRALIDEDLLVHFQPRVDLQTGEIRAAEALMRWIEETEAGAVCVAGPDEFISIAEQFGMIGDLDASALEQSVRQVRRWTEQGVDIAVSVNVSVMYLQQIDFVANVLDCIARHAVNPSSIELEITESAAMSNVEENIKKLQSLKEAGVRIAIDDFGTGYSSLSYLKKFPVDNLKIDRSFVMDLNEDNINIAAETAVVRSIVALAKSMDIGLVAEGIETEWQRQFICDLGCNEGQGFYYYKPMSAEDLADIFLGGEFRAAA